MKELLDPNVRDVSLWFELSRCNYLVLPRVLMEEMPLEWQVRFVAALDEMEATYPGIGERYRYRVHRVDESGRYVSDPLAEYRHPDPEFIEALRSQPEAE